MADAMGYVVDAMKNEAPIQDKLLCVSRLRVVALALGEEKTRSEMLPFLRKLRDPPVRWPGTRGEAPLETADAGSPRRRRAPRTLRPWQAAPAHTQLPWLRRRRDLIHSGSFSLHTLRPRGRLSGPRLHPYV